MVLVKLIGIDHPSLNNVDQVSLFPRGEVNFKIIFLWQMYDQKRVGAAVKRPRIDMRPRL